MSWTARKTVVVPVDFSEASIKAVDVARNFVQDVSQIHVIHVARDLNPVDPAILLGNVNVSDRRERLRESLEQRFAREEDRGINIRLELGNPGLEIVLYASRIGADLIVMPSHGRTGISRIALGSVAERVTRHATCPVLILRGEERQG